MCAINPKHKMRLYLDVFTSDDRMTPKEFENMVLRKAVTAEIELNADGRLRWHVSRSEEWKP